MIDQTIRSKLRNLAARSAIQGGAVCVDVGTLERDGRKQKKLLRELQEQGLADVDGNKVYPNERLLDDVAPETVAMFNIWQDCRKRMSDRSDTSARPWVRCSDLSIRQLKTVIDDEEAFTFYVVDTAPYQYSMSRWTKEAEVEDEHLCYWAGPFSLDEAQAHLAEVRSNNAGNKNWRRSLEIVVSMPRLPYCVNGQLFDERIDGMLPLNLAWGLVKLGILTEDEAYEPGQDEEKRRSRITASSLGSSMFMGHATSNLGEDPKQWGDMLSKGIGGCQRAIQDAAERLSLLTKVQVGIAAYGGWPKFLEDYRATLVEAVKEEDAKN